MFRMDIIYTLGYPGSVAEDLDFDWDRHNRSHIASHDVSTREFEEVIASDPFDLEYETESGEERYKSLGVTRRGRVLMVVWTLRLGKIRAITAYPAGKANEKLYWGIKR